MIAIWLIILWENYRLCMKYQNIDQLVISVTVFTTFTSSLVKVTMHFGCILKFHPKAKNPSLFSSVGHKDFV